MEYMYDVDQIDPGARQPVSFDVRHVDDEDLNIIL